MPRHPSYLWLSRHGIYYARVVIPLPLRPLFPVNKREIRRSLSTGNRREAIKRARAVLLELDQLFYRLGGEPVSGTAPSPEFAGTDPLQPLLPRRPAVEVTVMAPCALPAPDSTSQVITVPEEQPLLSEAVERYLADKTANGLREKTLAEYRASLSLAIQAIGDISLASLTRDHARDFRGKLLRLPANMSKVCPGRSIDEVLSSSKLNRLARMESRTVNKTLGRFSGFCAWAVAEDLIPKNPAAGLEVNINARPDEEAEPFLRDELQAIFDGYPYRGEIPKRIKAAPYQFWLPLLGLLTGARLNELSQLHLADIKQVDGLWVLSILDDEKDKQLKRATSRRVFPLHPMLLSLGLVDYARLLRNCGHKRLFPELPKRRDGYGQIPSKWFGRYRQRVGVEKPFHSFRHTVATSLKRAGHQEERVAEMLGHVRGQTESFRRYGKAYGPTALIDMVSSMDFGVSLVHVNYTDFLRRAGLGLPTVQSGSGSRGASSVELAGSGSGENDRVAATLHPRRF